MKRNISVFILLILLASSFKYRTKAKESGLALNELSAGQTVSSDAVEKAAFDKLVSELRSADQAFLKGDTEPFKALWSRQDDVTFMDMRSGTEAKGWENVNAAIRTFQETLPDVETYTSEPITSYRGKDQACILHKEKYLLKDGKSLDARTTIVLRKEMNAWKIIHKQMDILSSSK